ncbi:MAG: P-II family nitrogen regulator [bacterium]
MKRIEAIIRPEKLAHVKSALEKIGYSGLMISAVEGHGKQKGFEQQWRGEKYRVEFIPKTRIEIIVRDEEADRIVKTIADAARTGEIGDGKIFIMDVLETVRIRTNERGEGAL